MLDKEKFGDFRVFLKYAWNKLGLPDPTPLQYKMADIIQNIIKASGKLPGLEPSPTFTKRYPMLLDSRGRVTRRLILQAYRGIGKSWIDALAAVWCLGFNPDLNIMALSAAKTKSDEFTTFALQVIKLIPELQFLIPDKQKGDRTSALQFDVRGKKPSQAASVRSCGVFGQITGGRADIAFPDDVEVPKTSETQLLREKLAKTVQEIGGAIIKPDSVVIYLGTPQCEESLYDKLEKDRGYKKIIFPSRYPDTKWLSRYGGQLEPSILRKIQELGPSCQTGYGLNGNLGKSTDPQRFNEFELQDREREYGASGYALQFQLDTSLSDAERYPLRLRDLVVTDVTPKMPATLFWSSDPDQKWKDLDNVGFHGDGFYRPLNIKLANAENNHTEIISLTQCAMYIDPAGRGKDELGLALGYTCNGYIYLKHCTGFKAGYEHSNLVKIAELAKRYGVKEIITEPNFGDGMFDELLKPVLRDIYPCTVTPSEWSSAQKERRIIDTLEPVVNQHLLVVDPEVIRADRIPHPGDSQEEAQTRSLFYQYTRITTEKNCLRHDDRLDALAGLVNYFMKNLGIDQKRTAVDRQEAEMKKWIDKVGRINTILRTGKPPRNPTWFGGKKLI